MDEFVSLTHSEAESWRIWASEAWVNLLWAPGWWWRLVAAWWGWAWLQQAGVSACVCVCVCVSVLCLLLQGLRCHAAIEVPPVAPPLEESPEARLPVSAWRRRRQRLHAHRCDLGRVRAQTMARTYTHKNTPLGCGLCVCGGGVVGEGRIFKARPECGSRSLPLWPHPSFRVTKMSCIIPQTHETWRRTSWRDWFQRRTKTKVVCSGSDKHSWPPALTVTPKSKVTFKLSQFKSGLWPVDIQQSPMIKCANYIYITSSSSCSCLIVLLLLLFKCPFCITLGVRIKTCLFFLLSSPRTGVTRDWTSLWCCS